MPFAFVIAIILSTILLGMGIKFAAVTLWSAYWLVAILMSMVSIVKEKFSISLLVLPILFFLLHISYGIGTMIGIASTSK